VYISIVMEIKVNILYSDFSLCTVNFFSIIDTFIQKYIYKKLIYTTIIMLVQKIKAIKILNV